MVRLLRLFLPGVAAFLLWGGPALAASPSKLRVAVMPFDSASKDPQYAALGKGLQAMITTDLNAVGSYDLVERSRLADIQSELKLNQTGAIDTKTAAKIGKLAGASHLVAGTVTIFGDKMRIDARMFSVQTGKILLTEQITGAKDEFFDLPKQLVKKMVGITGVKMSPKVRVKVSRVHTADFKAFKTYSEGIQAFDRKDYKKSVKLLKRAAKIDPDFKLADLTLADYEEKIAGMKTLAVDTEVNKRKEKEIKQNKQAQKVAATLKELWKDARKPGKDFALMRSWALFKLFKMYDNAYSNMRGLVSFEDRFELERTADAVAAQYFAVAQKLFPQAPLAPTRHAHYRWTRIPENDRDQKRLERVTLDVRQRWDRMCERLMLSAKGCGQFMMSAASKLKRAGADREDLARMLITAGKLFRHALAVDASTAAFSDAQKLTKDPYTSKTMVKEVEANKQAKTFLKRCKNAWARELLMLKGWRGGWKFKDCKTSIHEDFQGDTLSLDGRYRLTQARSIPKGSTMTVGGTPVWVFGHRNVFTGPRSDLYRTNLIGYYEAKPRKYGLLSIFEGRKASNVSIALKTSFKPTDTWYPHGFDTHRPYSHQTATDHNTARPRLVVAFGLVDVDAPMRNDLKSGERTVVRPTTGYGVMVDAAGVHLVALREDSKPRELIRTSDYRDLQSAKKRIAVKILATKKASVQAKETLTWSVSVSGKSVKAKVGGKSFAFALPEPVENGYVGLWIDGPGYAHFGNLKVK